jgi:mRNA interferase RelE/StbE
MSYTLRFTKRASKALQRLDLTTAKRVYGRLRELSFDPFDPVLSYSLEMAKEKRSTRVGDWRIIYQIHESQKFIEVLTIAPRGRAYRQI